MYQYNQSEILLEKNGGERVSKCSRNLNVRYILITDMVERGRLRIEYFIILAMVEDYMTNPLQGAKFLEFRKDILVM